jgi:hypothetical protein
MIFVGTVEAAGRGGHAVAIPTEVAATFSNRRPAVVAQVNGTEYRSRLMVYGAVSYLGLRKDLLASIGAEVGDRLQVDLVEDESPRVVEVPTELTAALAQNPDVAEKYHGLPFTHRREYAEWVGSAKKAATRNARAARAVEMIADGNRS